jgi:putative tryptophan/tyrosine transport system substrate-binding protein
LRSLSLAARLPYRPGMERRRFLLTSLAGALLAPLAAGAQPAGKGWRIGFLSSQAASASQPYVEALRQGLRELGYVEGRNIAIEYRWAEGNYQRLPDLAKELVGLNVDLIFAIGGIPSARAAKAATKTIPIVFFARDPVAAGIASSIARPGGNLTGLDVFTADLDAKRLEILKEALPEVTRVAVLWNPADPTGVPQRKQVEVAAETLGLRIRVLEARLPGEIDIAFAAMVRERSEALLVLTDPMFTSERARIVDLAARRRLPAVYYWREFTEGGG